MTITAFTRYSDGKPMPEVSFCWGHYDLTVEQVFNAIMQHETAAA